MKVTAQELMDAGLWSRVCELEGLNPWCVNEGQMASTYVLVLSEATIRALLGLEVKNVLASPGPED